jgi:hypothetical protein
VRTAGVSNHDHSEMKPQDASSSSPLNPLSQKTVLHSTVGGRGGRGSWLFDVAQDSTTQRQQLEWQRQRLRRFFSRYSPKQMDSVDSILAKYVPLGDDFKTMWSDLEGQYGFESAIRSPPIPLPSQNSFLAKPKFDSASVSSNATMLPFDARYRLYRLMKVHDRAKVAYVEKVLKRYEGMEESLLRDTIARYGAEPQSEPIQDRIHRFLVQYDEANVASILPKLLSDYRGREMECLRDLHQRYGLEPVPPTPRGGGGGAAQVNPKSGDPGAASTVEYHRERLIRFVEIYCPEKRCGVERVLSKYGAMEGGWEILWSRLVTRYGSEPTTPPDARPPTNPLNFARKASGALDNAPTLL